MKNEKKKQQYFINWDKLSYSLRCRPFLHYYVPSFAPLCSKKDLYNDVTIPELLRQMVKNSNFLCDIEPSPNAFSKEEYEKNSITFARASLFRGPINSFDVENNMCYLKPQSDVIHYLCFFLFFVHFYLVSGSGYCFFFFFRF